MWLYVLGEVTGRDIKIGVTRDDRISTRRRAVDSDQMSDDRYVMLAGVRGPGMAEGKVHEFFREYRKYKGSRKEYYEPAEALIEWIIWLRQEWYVVHDEEESATEAYEVEPSFWLPTRTRREPRPAPDPSMLLQYEQSTGPLAGTWWSWMPDPMGTFQDYFTPEEIVRKASEAMGGIDLDAASHFLANRRLHKAGVHIGEFFTVNKSAFTHDWYGRVWLNPPYGENEKWLPRAEEMLDRGLVEQLCWLSPAWAFTTRVAQPMMRRSTAGVLLSPTPEFFNPGDLSKKGSNHPHIIFYWGHREEAFLDAFSELGIAVTLHSRPSRLELVG